jgi:hypothetical protein
MSFSGDVCKCHPGRRCGESLQHIENPVDCCTHKNFWNVIPEIFNPA